MRRKKDARGGSADMFQCVTHLDATARSRVARPHMLYNVAFCVFVMFIEQYVVTC